MPTVTHKQERISDVGQVESSTDQQDMDEEMYDEDWAAKQIDNLVTLSNLPSSRWQHLLKLDVIKVNQIKSCTPIFERGGCHMLIFWFSGEKQAAQPGGQASVGSLFSADCAHLERRAEVRPAYRQRARRHVQPPPHLCSCRL